MVKNRRTEVLILLLVIGLLALLFRLLPKPPAEPRPDVAVWGVRLGMSPAEVTRAFGAEPFLRREMGGRKVLSYSAAPGIYDAVVIFDADDRVAAVRGSAIDLQGHRLRLPLDSRCLARLLGERVTGGDQQKWFPDFGVGFQFRTTVGLKGGTTTHATCAWLGPRDGSVLELPFQLSSGSARGGNL